MLVSSLVGCFPEQPQPRPTSVRSAWAGLHKAGDWRLGTGLRLKLAAPHLFPVRACALATCGWRAAPPSLALSILVLSHSNHRRESPFLA
jgi:hypothetical protein